MKVASAGVLAVIAGLTLLSLAPVRPRTNPDINPGRTIEATLDVPAQVQGVLTRACFDCHSYQTRWPWYSRVAPASWIIAGDVERARQAVNFSEWSLQAGRKRTMAMGALAAACETTKIGRMPPATYRWLHPDANLSAADVQTLCRWSVAQMRQMSARAASVRHGHSPNP